MCSLFSSIVYLTLDTFYREGKPFILLVTQAMFTAMERGSLQITGLTETLLLACEQAKTHFLKLKLISIGLLRYNATERSLHFNFFKHCLDLSSPLCLWETIDDFL